VHECSGWNSAICELIVNADEVVFFADMVSGLFSNMNKF